MHLGSADEALTVLLAQTGDREALDRLYRSIQEPLYRRVFSIAGDRELAEDVVQDVFIIILRKLQWLRSPSHFRAWAFRIAAREAVRAAAKERRTPEAASDDSFAQIADPRPHAPIRAVEFDRLRAVMSELPPGSRAVLTLHYLDDLPLSEVAQILGLPTGTVKSRLSYGLGLLRARLDTGHDSDE